jgi:2-polyprenyl-3-methyl-5-hydroxy-6-metoxy-1,4-benzoquinol methylase
VRSSARLAPATVRGLERKRNDLHMEQENYRQIFSFEKRNWWYKGRRHLLRHILKGERRAFSNALDVGCGVGANLGVCDEFSQRVTGIDVSEDAVSYCKRNGFKNVIRTDVTEFTSQDEFDLVTCFDVLEHVDDRKAIHAISRVTKQGGKLIVMVPAHMSLWNDNDEFSHHLRRYERRELAALLEEEFAIEKLSYWNCAMFFPSYIFYKLQAFQENRTQKNNLTIIPSFMNDFLYAMIATENMALSWINLPQGVSLVAVATKK